MTKKKKKITWIRIKKFTRDSSSQRSPLAQTLLKTRPLKNPEKIIRTNYAKKNFTKKASAIRQILRTSNQAKTFMQRSQKQKPLNFGKTSKVYKPIKSNV